MTLAPLKLRLNLGGEGEEPDCINQQPPWVDHGNLTFAAPGNRPADAHARRHPVHLFCENTALPLPGSTVDEIVTNGVPVDQGRTWLGPTLDSNEIKRVLNRGGAWYHDGILVYRKP